MDTMPAAMHTPSRLQFLLSKNFPLPVGELPVRLATFLAPAATTAERTQTRTAIRPVEIHPTPLINIVLLVRVQPAILATLPLRWRNRAVTPPALMVMPVGDLGQPAQQINIHLPLTAKPRPVFKDRKDEYRTA